MCRKNRFVCVFIILYVGQYALSRLSSTTILKEVLLLPQSFVLLPGCQVKHNFAKIASH